jgi:hypothetical protein
MISSAGMSRDGKMRCCQGKQHCVLRVTASVSVPCPCMTQSPSARQQMSLYGAIKQGSQRANPTRLPRHYHPKHHPSTLPYNQWTLYCVCYDESAGMHHSCFATAKLCSAAAAGGTSQSASSAVAEFVADTSSTALVSLST